MWGFVGVGPVLRGKDPLTLSTTRRSLSRRPSRYFLRRQPRASLAQAAPLAPLILAADEPLYRMIFIGGLGIIGSGIVGAVIVGAIMTANYDEVSLCFTWGEILLYMRHICLTNYLFHVHLFSSIVSELVCAA